MSHYPNLMPVSGPPKRIGPIEIKSLFNRKHRAWIASQQESPFHRIPSTDDRVELHVYKLRRKQTPVLQPDELQRLAAQPMLDPYQSPPSG